MSRAINTTLKQDQVSALCNKAGVSISDIEALPCGGTHLVCTTSEGAEEMRHQLKRNLIEGKVKRYAFFALRGWN
jgi:hypothetical protein